MKAINYLQFNGRATEAIAYYREVLPNPLVKQVTFSEMGDSATLQLTKEEKNMIMEASLEFLGNTLMLSDVPPFMQQSLGSVSQGNSLIISLIDGDPQVNQEIYQKLLIEGTILMPLGPVPWSTNFGLLKDKFGITWKFNSDATKFLTNF